MLGSSCPYLPYPNNEREKTWDCSSKAIQSFLDNRIDCASLAKRFPSSVSLHWSFLPRTFSLAARGDRLSTSFRGRPRTGYPNRTRSSNWVAGCAALPPSNCKNTKSRGNTIHDFVQSPTSSSFSLLTASNFFPVFESTILCVSRRSLSLHATLEEGLPNDLFFLLLWDEFRNADFGECGSRGMDPGVSEMWWLALATEGVAAKKGRSRSA